MSLLSRSCSWQSQSYVHPPIQVLFVAAPVICPSSYPGLIRSSTSHLAPPSTTLWGSSLPALRVPCVPHCWSAWCASHHGPLHQFSNDGEAAYCPASSRALDSQRCDQMRQLLLISDDIIPLHHCCLLLFAYQIRSRDSDTLGTIFLTYCNRIITCFLHVLSCQECACSARYLNEGPSNISV
jgi:hypothetical protein